MWGQQFTLLYYVILIKNIVIMELIDKYALVVEIEKRQKEEVFYDEDGSFASWTDQYHYSILESIKNLIKCDLIYSSQRLTNHIKSNTCAKNQGIYLNFRNGWKTFFTCI